MWGNIGVMEARRLEAAEMRANYDLRAAMEDEGEELKLKLLERKEEQR